MTRVYVCMPNRHCAVPQQQHLDADPAWMRRSRDARSMSRNALSTSLLCATYAISTNATCMSCVSLQKPGLTGACA